jgi:hypothetical protein
MPTTVPNASCLPATSYCDLPCLSRLIACLQVSTSATTPAGAPYVVTYRIVDTLGRTAAVSRTVCEHPESHTFSFSSTFQRHFPAALALQVSIEGHCPCICNLCATSKEPAAVQVALHLRFNSLQHHIASSLVFCVAHPTSTAFQVTVIDHCPALEPPCLHHIYIIEIMAIVCKVFRAPLA